MDWWQIPYSILLVASVYAYPTYLLWTWPATVEVDPTPDGGEGQPHPIPLPRPGRGDFLDLFGRKKNDTLRFAYV